MISRRTSWYGHFAATFIKQLGKTFAKNEWVRPSTAKYRLARAGSLSTSSGSGWLSGLNARTDSAIACKNRCSYSSGERAGSATCDGGRKNVLLVITSVAAALIF